MVDSYLAPGRKSAGVRRDFAKVAGGADAALHARSGREAEGLRQAGLLAWAVEDKLFPLEYAHRLAAHCRTRRSRRSTTRTRSSPRTSPSDWRRLSRRSCAAPRQFRPDSRRAGKPAWKRTTRRETRWSKTRRTRPPPRRRRSAGTSAAPLRP